MDSTRRIRRRAPHDAHHERLIVQKLHDEILEAARAGRIVDNADRRMAQMPRREA